MFSQTDMKNTETFGTLLASGPSKGCGNFSKVPGVMDGYRIRKLTPLECFRLQSFPDDWYYKLKEHGISDSQLYKMAGNAVTSVVAYEISRRIIAANAAIDTTA